MLDGVPVDQDGDVREPTNPDLWGSDPYYDRNERPRFAAWALALCLVLVLLIVGGLSWMWGRGSLDDEPVSSETIYATITKQAAGLTPAPKTITKTAIVTRKSQVMLTPAPAPVKTLIVPKTIAPQSTLTAYRTRPRVTVTVRATITRTAFSEPSEAIRCFRVRLGEIRAEIPCP